MEHLEANRIVENIDNVVEAIMADSTTGKFETAARLDFIARLVQIAGQTYETLYIILMRASLITIDDVYANKADSLAQRVDQLVAGGLHHDVEIIANRLRALRADSNRSIGGLLERQPRGVDWHFMLSTIDERESPIITDLQHTAFELRKLLSQTNHFHDKIVDLHTLAASRAAELRTAIARLHRMMNWILGMQEGQDAAAQPAAAATAQKRREPAPTTGYMPVRSATDYY